MPAQGASTAAQRQLQAKCGPEQVRPTAPTLRQPLTYEDVRRAGLAAASGSSSGSGGTSGAGASSSGPGGGAASAAAPALTAVSYRILRERVAPFVQSRGKSSRMPYTQDELAALQAALPRLQPYSDALLRY